MGSQGVAVRVCVRACVRACVRGPGRGAHQAVGVHGEPVDLIVLRRDRAWSGTVFGRLGRGSRRLGSPARVASDRSRKACSPAADRAKPRLLGAVRQPMRQPTRNRAGRAAWGCAAATDAQPTRNRAGRAAWGLCVPVPPASWVARDTHGGWGRCGTAAIVRARQHRARVSNGYGYPAGQSSCQRGATWDCVSTHVGLHGTA